MALADGSNIGPYEIRGPLGAGGMGMVYRAHDPRLGRDIALKILPENVANDAHSLARFTREARAVASLNHPHIVTIHSTEEVEGLRFITMELIEGRTPTALMIAILKDHPRAIPEIRRDAPEGIAQLIALCLEKNPRDRIQTMQEILIELKAHRRAWESGSSAAKPRTSSVTAQASEESRFRIAVLPVQSRTANNDAEALADGLTDDITAGLARFPYLRVVSRPDAEAAKGRAADARAAALVGARYLLEGTVRTAGTVTRLNARLIDVETGGHLWAETYDRQLTSENVFDMQDDLTNRIVATVADSAGVLVRSMAGTIRDRAAQDLSLDELVLRYFAHQQTLRVDEHAVLRAAFESALETQPTHALAWACLADFYELEHSIELNPRPDAQVLARKAAERSIEIDPTCQQGWRQLAMRSHFERDLNGLRMAAERTVQLNPLSAAAAYMGLLLAYAGEWDRGMSLVRRAMDLTPQYLNVLHIPVFLDHYRRGEFEDALTQMKRANLSHHVGTLISSAAAAGQLGRVTDAKAAFDGLRRHHPAHVDPDKVRSFLAGWVWDEGLIEQLIDGFLKAKALEAAPGVHAVRAAPESASQPNSSASIAVLAFTDMSAAKDQEWFCDGIAEEILNALSQLQGMRVAARASAFSFRGKGDDLKAIGEKLQVATVLDGSVRRAGDQVRITVRLSDVANGYQLWSDRYDRNLSDIFDVQEEIARAVAARLRGTRTDDSGVQPHVIRHTENQEAYHLFLRGRHLWHSRSKGSLQRARELFEEASRKDPDYVLPWVGLAELFAIQSLYGFEREKYANPRAQEAVNRALALNDRIADAHRSRGLSLLFCAGYDPKAAARAFERSITLDPASGLAHIWVGWPTWPGRESVAIAAARRALELDPLNPYIHSCAGAIYDFYDRAEEGLREFDKAFEIDPNYLVGLYLGGGVYSRRGRHDEALRLFARGVELSDRAPFYLSYHGWALARAGRIEEARAALAELEARAQTEYVQYVHLAIVYSALGEMDRAFELLELATRDHNGWIGCPRMPMFEDFRKDPRYKEHLRRIGHPDAG